MSQPNNVKCLVCGGVEFIVDAGSFFCLECNTQTQDVREEVFDEYFGAQKAVTRVLLKKSSKEKTSDANVKLTSWELLNYVLKGVTLELIELGAKPELKVMVLQLWASYLRNLEIAFTSVDIERKPKLGYSFKISDAEIVYGVTSTQLRQKSWRSRSSSNASRASSNSSRVSKTSSPSSKSGGSTSRRSALILLNIRKKALASAEYSQLSQNATASLSQTLDALDSSSENDAETPKRMKITQHAKKILKSPSHCSSSEDTSSVHRRFLKKEISSTRNVTTAKLVAIVNIALALTHENIQLSDFIRWVEEGHISLGSPKKFLPENAKVSGEMEKCMELEHLSYRKCQSVMLAMCNELDISALPIPDLCGLAERYCTELQLPDELMKMVQRLLTLFYGIDEPKQDLNVNWKKGELLAMAAILFVMKLLFSLDDSTEHKLSKTASVLNRLYAAERAEGGGDSTQLFSWSEWVRYIECRKAVVAAHHLPTKTAVYGNSVPHVPHLFVQHFAQTAEQQRGLKEGSKYYTLDKDWVEVLSRCLSKLSVDADDGPRVVFPASLTPLHSSLKVLLSQHAERVAPAAHVLRQDFTSHSLQHVTSPEQCLALGLFHDLNIVIKDGAAATFNREKIRIREKDLLTIPKSKINQVNLVVRVTKSINQGNGKDMASTVGDLNKNDKFSEIIEDDSDEEQDVDDDLSDKTELEGTLLSDSPLELFTTSSEYWFCHPSLTKHSTTNEEFEFMAMKTFSFSFLWLLKECSRIISIHPKELYSYLVVLEKDHKYFADKFVCKKNKKDT